MVSSDTASQEAKLGAHLLSFSFVETRNIELPFSGLFPKARDSHCRHNICVHNVQCDVLYGSDLGTSSGRCRVVWRQRPCNLALVMLRNYTFTKASVSRAAPNPHHSFIASSLTSRFQPQDLHPALSLALPEPLFAIEMLKRQRASSPLPLAQATIPESPPISSDHGVKRRRIFAPSLDGPSRGWGGSSVASGDEEDDDDTTMDGRTLTTRRNLHESSPESAGPYKIVNSLLHDLHAEQQHRRLVASPHPPSAPFSSHGWSSPVPLPVARKPSFVMHPAPQDVLAGVKSRPPCEEDVSVYERYEETNR